MLRNLMFPYNHHLNTRISESKTLNEPSLFLKTALIYFKLSPSMAEPAETGLLFKIVSVKDHIRPVMLRSL